MMKSNPTLFEDYKIRRLYDESKEIWFFSVVDVIRALIQQPDFQSARKYWNKLKERLNKEGSETVTNCHRLKMVAEDGKLRLTNTGGIAKKARIALETKTLKKVVTTDNFLSLRKVPEKLSQDD